MKIGGEPSERITERIMRHQQAVDVTHVGSQCELSLKIPGELRNYVSWKPVVTRLKKVQINLYALSFESHMSPPVNNFGRTFLD